VIKTPESNRVFAKCAMKSLITSHSTKYDEYNFDLDTIEHDPYVLISILSACPKWKYPKRGNAFG